MRNSNLLQKIGFFFVGVSIVSKVLSKILHGEISQIFWDMQLIGFLGVIVWAVGFFIQEGKKKFQPSIEKHPKIPEKVE